MDEKPIKINLLNNLLYNLKTSRLTYKQELNIIARKLIT